MLRYLGFEPTVYSIAEIYSDIISDIVIDFSDSCLASKIRGRLGVEVALADITMTSIDSKVALAQRLLNMVKGHRQQGAIVD